jgi:tryptophan halogenase
MNRIPNKIVIIGGGSAGWMSALYLLKMLPETDVTLIESTKIGILGAGEGSTPNFVQFIKDLEINEEEFINETKSTRKFGIDFEGWRGDGNKYLHYFNPKNIHNSYDKQIVHFNWEKINNYSFHFDANLVAKYFKKKSIERGIKWIDDEAKTFDKNDNGDIVKINLVSGESVSCDFIFDCSGFHRVVLGKEFDVKWIPQDKYLKVNTALPYTLPRTDASLDTVTRAVAMKYGWMWMIPLQNRWGCGYIFDKNLITKEEAKSEVEEFIGEEINNTRTIDFSPGWYEKVWVKNCLAIGLSGGFLEPLEATSIATLVWQLTQFKKFMIKLQTNGNVNVDEYNSMSEEFNEQNMHFIYYHYICDRDDTEFWNHYTSRKDIPEKLNEILDENLNVKIKNSKDLLKIYKYNQIYAPVSWYVINHGTRKNSNKLL